MARALLYILIIWPSPLRLLYLLHKHTSLRCEGMYKRSLNGSGQLINESDPIFVHLDEGSKAKDSRREQEEKREQLARYIQHIANASRSVVEPFQGNGRVFDAKHAYLPCIQS